MARRVGWILLAPVIGLVALLLCEAIPRARHRAALNANKQRLKQIGEALYQYHDKYECFPPAYVAGADGKSSHSWRVLLLPFLNQEPLYRRYHFDEPWDGPHNRELHALRPDVYASGLATSKRNDVTTFLGVVSRRSMWPATFSLKATDVTDGSSNTLWLLENVGSDVVWAEPREMTESEALGLFSSPSGAERNYKSGDSIPVLLVDGTTRAILPHIFRDLFVSVLTPKFGSNAAQGSWPQDDRDAPSLPKVRDVSHYRHTQVCSVPDSIAESNQTILYCATTQLGWDLLRPGLNQSVSVSNGSATTQSLNAHPFPKDALASDAYFAKAVDLMEDQSGTLIDDLKKRFPDAPVDLLGNMNGFTGIRILAYLEKSLPFPDVMERFPLPMSFKIDDETVNVNSFGWPAARGEGNDMPVLKSTVEICDYVARNDFIVNLKSNNPRKDEIILARIRPEKTLQATWDAASNRIQQPKASRVHRELRTVDLLQIPIISFGVTAKLKDLVGVGVPTPAKPERFIVAAQQVIRFRIDEYGAELIADTQMVVGDFGEDAIHNSKLEPRELIFDGPFLLALREENAEVPYFLAWIGNADLMEQAK